MAAFVYIFSHKEKPRFKIGKAIDISARLSVLKADEFDFTKSSALQVKDGEAANNLERALHRCFDKWRLSPDDILQKEGARFDGYTEWFRLECFARLMSFIDQNEELFDYKRLGPDQLLKHIKENPKKVKSVKSASTVALNTEKLGISLLAAERIEWPIALTWKEGRKGYDEVRMCAISYIGNELYYVTYADRDEVRWIISLRKATLLEINRYREANSRRLPH